MSTYFAFAAAFAIVFFFWKSRINWLAFPNLRASSTSSAPIPDNLTIIIPARDEATNIARAVSSFAGLPVIVVDDRSSDSTAAVAAQAGAIVIPAPSLAAGHFGKPNACQTGAGAATTDWLLFVDADTWFDPGFATALIAYVQREKLEAASVFPRQECLTFAEKLLVPYAFALYFCGVEARAVNSPRSSEALANGQCLLFRREAYFKIGGHAAVATSVIEDAALARLAKRHRLRYRALRSDTLAHVRMYDSLGAIWRGFEKNSFRFLMANPITGIEVILASIAATSWLPALIWAGLEGQWLAAFAPVAALIGVFIPIEGKRAVQVPLAVYLFQAIALASMFSTIFGRKVMWKGRRV